jgi:hypothetical protein
MSGLVRDIPAVAEMIAMGPRFVTWKYEERTTKAGKVELAKVPMQPNGRRKAASDKPATWGTYDACARTVERRDDIEGLGPVLGKLSDDPERHLSGVDLDNAIEPETGCTRPWAQEVIDDFNTYTEVSPSGTGYKLYCLVDRLPPLPSKKLVIRAAPDEHHNEQIEVFPSGRYFCLTGQHLDGTPDTLEDTTEAMARLAHRLAAAKPTAPGSAILSTHPAVPINPDWPEVVHALLDSDDRFKRGFLRGVKLTKGGDPSASGLDWSMALWLGRQQMPDEQIEAVLRCFPHGQDKSDRDIERLLEGAVRERERTAGDCELDLSEDGLALSLGELWANEARFVRLWGQ